MMTFLQALEERVVKHTIANAATLFPQLKDSSDEKIQSIFRSSLKPPKDPKFSPLWRVKVPVNARPAEFYYKDDKIPLEEIINHTKLASVIEVRGVWYMPEAYGLSFTLLQARVEEIPTRKPKRQEGDVNESQ
jgi:hypothetical protein